MVFQDQRNQSGSLATWHTVKDVEDESVLKLVGFIFHKISLSISVILVLWVLMKIVCFGSHLLHRRLEVFDTFVILTSFVVDMIFVKGLSMYTLKQFVYILAFMLPWRVIRVTNSLVVAVKDHEHFRLKMLFTQKKKIEHDNKQIRAERDSYKVNYGGGYTEYSEWLAGIRAISRLTTAYAAEQVEALKKLCLSEGIDDWKIFQSLARQQIRPGSKGVMGSFASLAFGAFGNKSTSFWSVLDTPKMRRGKSMEVVAQNRINNSETNVQNQKRHSKAKILGFLGSSADYLRGKIRNGHHLSLDSDPGPLKANTSLHQNGHIGKRLVRGETIDTVSTESNDDLTERQCSTDDYPKQSTIESSVFGGSLSPSLIVNEGSMQMFRTQSDSATARPPLCHSSCLQETSCSIEHPVEQQPKRRASVGAMDSLTVTYRADYCRSSSDDVFRNETSEV
ncbi:HVCN1-like protein [Mya arenaria]|uniref:HVCN1-like protein n=1 Tax=Mya arenaria TaxID=6604 RepID=A0ABY7E4H4_MYAAR|nr:HVCN1-like protein [Mya arenaria]